MISLGQVLILEGSTCFYTGTALFFGVWLFILSHAEYVVDRVLVYKSLTVAP